MDDLRKILVYRRWHGGLTWFTFSSFLLFDDSKFDDSGTDRDSRQMT